MTINITLVRIIKLLHAFCYRRNYILLFVFILTGFEAISQPAESLTHSLKNEPQSKRDSICYELFKVYRVSDIQNAKYYAKEAFQLASKYGHYLLQAKACRALAYAYNKSNELDSTRCYFHDGIQISLQHNFTAVLTDLYNDFGLFYERLDVYDSALHYFTLSYNLANQSQSYKAQAIASANIGLVYSNLENYVEAAVYFKQADHIVDKYQITENFDLNLNHMNLARVFNEQGLYSEAIEQLKKIEVNCKNGCDDNTLTGLNYGLGYANLKKGNKTEAYDLFTQALAFARKCGDKQWLANTLYQLATFSITNNNYSEAIQYLSNAETIAREISHRRLLRDTYHQLSTVYDKMGNSKKARQYEQLHWHLKDSIFNEVVARNLKNIQLSEQRKESNAIIEQKETALEKSYILAIILAINCAMALAIAYLIYRFLKASKTNKKEIDNHIVKLLDESENKQKELFRSQMEYDALSSRVRSFLSGPVATLGGMGHVFKNVATLDDLQECAEKLLWLTSNIQTVLENMNELVLVKHYDVAFTELNISVLVEDIRKMSTYPLLTVTVNKSVSLFIIESDKTLLLMLINNAIRYFDHSNENPVVELFFDQLKAESVTKVTIKHYSTNNVSIPHKNQFNLLTVLMASGKLNAEALLIQHSDHTVFEIFIPTDFTTRRNKSIEENIQVEGM